MASAIISVSTRPTTRPLAEVADFLAVAERDLAELAPRTSALEPSCVVAERLGNRLGTLAHQPGCPDRIRTLLLDWRSRLASHLLAARTLQDVNAAPHLALRMVRRGVASIADELASTTAEP